MGSERADFYASLDLRQVDASLKKTRENIDQSVGGHAERALSKLDGASSKAAKALGGLQFAFGGVAGGARGAMKDLGDIAMILGSGGVLGIALTAAAIGIGKMYQEATEADRRIADLHKTLRNSLAKSLEEVVAKAEEAERRLLSFGEAPQKIAVVQAETAFGSAVAQEQNAQQALAAWMDRRRKLFSERTKIDHDEFMARSEQLKADHAVLSALLDKARGSIPFLQRQMDAERKLLDKETEKTAETLRRNLEKIDAAAARKKPGKAPGAGAAQFAGSEDWRADKEKWEAEQEKAHQEMVDEWMAQEQRFRDLENKKLDAFDKSERAKTKIAQQEAAKRTQVAETEAKEQAQMYAGVAMAVASVTADLVVAGVTGQREAVAAVLAAASHSAGGFVMLEGAKIFASGVAELITTAGASPHGWAMTAGGSALIGAGAAIQSGGPAAINALMGTAKGGGASGGAAATDRGAPIQRSGRGSGGSSGGGGVTIVNQWGVAGPTADEQARAMRRVVDRMNDGRF